MPDQEIIDALIASYRELNHRLRGVSLEALPKSAGQNGADDSVEGILRQIRDRELRASQAIKRMLLGEEASEDDEGTAVLAEYQDRTDISPTVLLSQFGTAREATLAMVRELPDEEWNRSFYTPRGHMTLRDYLKTLVDRDRQRIEQIDALLAKVKA